MFPAGRETLGPERTSAALLDGEGQRSMLKDRPAHRPCKARIPPGRYLSTRTYYRIVLQVDQKMLFGGSVCLGRAPCDRGCHDVIIGLCIQTCFNSSIGAITNDSLDGRLKILFSERILQMYRFKNFFHTTIICGENALNIRQ